MLSTPVEATLEAEATLEDAIDVLDETAAAEGFCADPEDITARLADDDFEDEEATAGEAFCAAAEDAGARLDKATFGDTTLIKATDAPVEVVAVTVIVEAVAKFDAFISAEEELT